MTAVATFPDRLAAAIRRSRSAVCVGLDPRSEQLPISLQPRDAWDCTEKATAYQRFCCEVIDAVAGRVGVVKPQAAFFEQLGPAGMVALAHVIRHAAARELLVILDGKRNDIGTTAQAYAEGYLGAGTLSAWGADALTVSPYLGDDSLQPFVDICVQRQAGIFVLVKTSNPGSGFVQDLVIDKQTVYERVAAYLTTLNRRHPATDGYGPIGAVVGATYPEQLSQLRGAMPNAWILVPGYGAQGGGARDVAAAFDPTGCGAIINNSRHVIFAYQRPEYAARFGETRWQDAVAAAVDAMNDELRGETAMGRL